MYTYIKKGKKQYKANLHCHSVLSDGKLTDQELRDAYKNEGYSILAITDHETPHDHTHLSDKDFLMLTGYEVYIRPLHTYNRYMPEIHMNLIATEPHNTKYIGLDKRYCKYLSQEDRDNLECVGIEEERVYSPRYINRFVKSAKQNGYICTYNHPVWSFEDFSVVSKYKGFFSMEICNYSSFLINRQEYNGALYDLLLREGSKMFAHGSDDNHNKKPFGDPGCDSFGAYTMVLCDKLDYKSVIKALKKGDFYASMGPEIKELTFDGNKVHIETSEAKQITMFFGAKNPSAIIGNPENPVTQADFEIPEDAKYVRFSIYDFEGRYADTRGFSMKELGL